MSGEDFQEEALPAAVKPLKIVERTTESTAYATLPTPRGISESDKLAALFERHHSRVFRTAYRVTGSPADAEDVLQTVFLRVARAQDAAEAAQNPEAYFARAAINASLDLIRSRKRSRAVALDDIENQASSIPQIARNDPASHHEDQELRNLLREAVARLGTTAGQMFTLRYFEGFSNAEIAQAMNTSALVVGVTLHRARTRLRKQIGRYLQAGEKD